MRDRNTRSNNDQELIEQAKEMKEKLDWKKIYALINRMSKRVKAVIINKGSHARR